jgi:hypothetical protein
MVAIVKEFKRNSEGHQWFDTEVFCEEIDAEKYMNEKVRHLVEDGYTLKVAEKNHQYVVDEEEGSEFEYMIEQKIIRGQSAKPLLYQNIPFEMNQILPNGWKTEWIDVGLGESLFTISKRFVSDKGNLYLIHMDLNSMKMVYVKDETRKYNEDRGSFEVGGVWEPNEIVLLHKEFKNQEAFEQYRHLINKANENEIAECYYSAKNLWNMIYNG